jgi:hypothetical protein
MSVGRYAFDSAVTALVAALVTSSCGGSSPASQTPAVTLAPSATPTPTTSGGSPAAASCPLGEGSYDAECGKASSRLAGAVTSAMDLLVQQQPALFDMTDEAGSGTRQYRVLAREAYLDGLVARLRAAGYCAQRDPDDYTYERLQVKSENGFSEAFDVLTGTGFMRRGGYVTTCTPASFPVERGDLPAFGSGCGAPYPPPISRMNCKVHLFASDVHTLDSTPIVGPDAGVLRGRRLHRRARALRGATGNQPRAGAVRDVAHWLRPGHGAARSDVDQEREVLHRPRERLREPPHQPVRAARLRRRPLHRLRRERRVLQRRRSVMSSRDVKTGREGAARRRRHAPARPLNVHFQ